MSTIGQRIRTIRKTNNLNQIKFANTIRISQGTLSELEQDKYKPSLDILIAIKENFNSHIEWLIFAHVLYGAQGAHSLLQFGYLFQ